MIYIQICTKYGKNSIYPSLSIHSGYILLSVGSIYTSTPGTLQDTILLSVGSIYSSTPGILQDTLLLLVGSIYSPTPGILQDTILLLVGSIYSSPGILQDTILLSVGSMYSLLQVCRIIFYSRYTSTLLKKNLPGKTKFLAAGNKRN